MYLAFLFLYRKIEQTSVFSSKKYINWAAKNKTSDGRSIGRSIHDGPKKIQTGPPIRGRGLRMLKMKA